MQPNFAVIRRADCSEGCKGTLDLSQSGIAVPHLYPRRSSVMGPFFLSCAFLDYMSAW